MAVVLLAGCSHFTDFAKSRADRAAYGIIGKKQRAALGSAEDFTIDYVADEATSRVLTSAAWLERAEDNLTTPSLYLPLTDALAIAVTNNRSYLRRKENVYRQALSLTETRREFGELAFTGSLDGEWTHEVSGHGTAAGPVSQDSGSLVQALGISVKKTIVTGAEITIDATHAFTRYFVTNTPDSGTNELVFRVVQPLMRNVGSLVVLEPLRQAERDMIYEVREFQRYRQDFVIDIVSSFYSLLQARDQLSNSWNDYLSAVANRERAEAWASENRLAPIEADQARQREYEAESRYVANLASYLTQLDEFKMQLGLPIDLDFAPDPLELHRLFMLSAGGLPKPDMTPRQAIDLALTRRLDLRTQEDRLEDTRREVRIARRQFLPTLDAFFEYSTTEDHGDPHLTLDFKDHVVTGGFNFTLPTNWTERRNNYRRACIEYERARRALEEKRDDVALEVLSTLRQLERRRRDYEIQRQSVALAERRVERATILQEEGQGTQRDLLEAQDDLLTARNALTAAVVNYTIQRLRFWEAVEGIEVDRRGGWELGNDTGATQQTGANTQ